jgi:hypothetical protein
MPCNSKSVTLWLDIHGKQTGIYPFECSGDCPDEEREKNA